MTKCRVCGELNPDGNKFCAACGARLEDNAKAALTEALENAEKEFDKDSLVSMDKSRITYVCSVCGSVNRIDQDKCSRCGKPRPRSEYINALRRIKQGEALREERATLVAPIAVAAPVPVLEPEPAPEPEPQPEPEQTPAPAPVVQAVSGQAPAVQQPFVIVPYVNPTQPLWQYNPNQLYRYEAYTPEELEARRQQREMEEMQRKMQEAAAAAAANAAQPAPATEAGAPVAAKAKKSRLKPALIGILSLAAVVVLAITCFMADLTVYGGKSAIDMFTWQVGIENTWQFVLQVSAIATICLAAFTFIYSFIRLIVGKRCALDWLAPLVWLAASALFVVSAYMWDNGVAEIGIAGWVAAVASVPAFIIGIVSSKKAKKPAKAAKTGEKK